MALTADGSSGHGRILIGFAEAVAAPEAAWSLLDAGFDVVAVGRAGRRCTLRHVRGVDVIAVTPPELDAAATIRELVRICRDAGVAAVLPLDDPAVWVADAAARQMSVPIVGPTGPRAALALDKRVQLAAARRHGIATPRTTVCETRGEALALADEPLILRPALAVHERGGALARGPVRRCRTRADLERAVAAWDETVPLLAQPLIAGTGSGLFGLATADGIGWWSAHRRLRTVDPLGSGSSACVSANPDPALLGKVASLLDAVGWRGPFMVELLCDPHGRVWFVELNGRCWGSLALARRLGWEYPAWAVGDTLGQPLAPADRMRTEARDAVVCRHLGRELLHLAAVLRGPRPGEADRWPSRAATARAVLRVGRGERWYNWRSDAPGVLVADTVATLLDAAGARSRR